MLSVRAIYDGYNLKLLEKIQVETPKNVIITFLDNVENETFESNDIHQINTVGGGLEFLKDAIEDIYSDTDLKVKY